MSRLSLNHKLLAATFAAGCLASCSTTRKAEAPKAALFTYDYRIEDFANGLRLITIPTDYPEIVSLHLLVGTGSRNEIEEGRSGFAHFFEHMMFRGTKNFTSTEQAEIFKSIGADRNAYTTDDYTNYHTTFAKEDLETVMKLEADRFRYLEYSKKVFRTESQAVFGEYNKNSANPISKMFEVVRDAAFQTHPYKHTTMGFLRDIVKMPKSYDYSREFFERWYKPENVTIVVTGDVTHEDTRQLTEKYFGDWKRGTYTVEIPEEPPQQQRRTPHVEWPSPTQPWITVAFHGPAFDPTSKAMPALDVLASVAFSESSELYKRLFVQERKVDTLFSYFPDHKDPFLLMVCARVKDVADLSEVRDQILGVCESLKARVVSKERLDEVKANLKYSFAAGLDSSAAIADNLAGYLASTRDPGAINELFHTYDSVTAADLQRVARSYFVVNASTICTLSHGAKPELRPITLLDVPLEAEAKEGTATAPPVDRNLKIPGRFADPVEGLFVPSRSPLISFRLVFPTGAAADPAGKEGLASIAAQMLTRGGTAKRTYDQVVAGMFPFAASVQVSVDKQMTVFSGSVHQDNLGGFYHLFREMLTEPGFRQEDLDRIKSNQVSAIDVGLRRSDDEETGKEVLYQEIYRGHPYGHLNLGTIEGVQSITIEDVKQFYRENLRNPFLGLSGNYPEGFPSLVASNLKGAFGSLRDAAEKRDFRIGIQRPKQSQLTIVEKDTRATGIHLGFPIGVNRAHEDWPALWLIRSYFGEHRSENSYLYQRLREIRGLNYGDYAYIEYFPNGGGQFHPAPNLARTSQIFQIWIRPVPPENGPFAFRAMNYELDKLIREGMSEEDFEATRAYLTKFVNLLVASQDRQLGYAIDSRFYGIGDFATHVKEGLARLTLKDVNGVIERHLRRDRVQFVVVTKNAAEFRDKILGEEPTPITYTSTPSAEILEEDKVIEVFPVALDASAVKIVPVEQVFQKR